MTLQRAFESIRRKIGLLIGKFLLAAVDDSGADALGRVTVQRVSGTIFAGERQLEDRAHYQSYGLSAHPIPGSAEGIALAPQGSRSQLVIVALDDPEHRPTDLAEGEVAIYTDEREKIILCKRGDELEIRADTFDWVADSTILLGNFSGNISLSCLAGGITLLSWGSGPVAITCLGGPVNVAGTAINLTGTTLVLTGNVTITGSVTINSKTCDETHTHSGVTTGSGNTGPVN